MTVEPGVYEVRGPNDGTVRLEVPSPGLTLEAFAAKLESGEWTLADPPKLKGPPRRKATAKGG